jgi:hypothetical protein
MKDVMKKERPTAAPSGKYEPVDCPGSPKANCQALDVWGAAWEAWGEEVRAALKALDAGGTTNVSPPPPPPFRP